MNISARRLMFALPLCLALAGCVNDTPAPAVSSVSVGASPFIQGDLGTLTYRGVDLLLTATPQVSHQTPIVVASVSNVQNVETTSALGNIVSDMIRTRIVQDGYLVSEIRLRNGVSFKNGDGEFLLSRNRHAVMPARDVAAIVTGTYAVSFEKVYVSLKLLSAVDAHIISAADFVLPLHGVEGLLQQYKS